MWGVGCVFFEILSLYPLFPGIKLGFRILTIQVYHRNKYDSTIWFNFFFLQEINIHYTLFYRSFINGLISMSTNMHKYLQYKYHSENIKNTFLIISGMIISQIYKFKSLRVYITRNRRL